MFATPIIIFVLLFSKIDIHKFMITFKEINIAFFLAGTLIFLFNDFFIMPLQWLRSLLSLGYSLSLKEAIIIKAGSFPARFILPFKIGDLVRAVYLDKQKGIPFYSGASSIYINIFLNLFVLIVIMSLGHSTFSTNPLYMVLFFSGLLLLFLLATRVFGYTKHLILYFARKNNFRLYVLMRTLFDILDRPSLRDLGVLFFYSVIHWVFELIVFFILFRAAGLVISIDAILVFVPLIILISYLPISISGIATREAAILFWFSGFGPPEKLLSTGILISFLNLFLPLIISLFFVRRFLNRLYSIPEDVLMNSARFVKKDNNMGII